MIWCTRAKKGACVCTMLLQSCLALCNPRDCSLPGSSVHRILQARILEWVATPSSRGIFLTQRLKPHLLGLLPWQVGSSPLALPGKGDPCCPNSQKVLQLSRGWPSTQLILPLDFLSRVAVIKNSSGVSTIQIHDQLFSLQWIIEWVTTFRSSQWRVCVCLRVCVFVLWTTPIFWTLHLLCLWDLPGLCTANLSCVRGGQEVPGHWDPRSSLWFSISSLKNIDLFIWLCQGLSCSTWNLSLLSCPIACGILVPWPGTEPECPALEGVFLTTGPLGKCPSFPVPCPCSPTGIFSINSQVDSCARILDSGSASERTHPNTLLA